MTALAAVMSRYLLTICFLPALLPPRSFHTPAASTAPRSLGVLGQC